MHLRHVNANHLGPEPLGWCGEEGANSGVDIVYDIGLQLGNDWLCLESGMTYDVELFLFYSKNFGN